MILTPIPIRLYYNKKIKTKQTRNFIEGNGFTSVLYMPRTDKSVLHDRQKLQRRHRPRTGNLRVLCYRLGWENNWLASTYNILLCTRHFPKDWRFGSAKEMAVYFLKSRWIALWCNVHTLLGVSWGHLGLSYNISLPIVAQALYQHGSFEFALFIIP